MSKSSYAARPAAPLRSTAHQYAGVNCNILTDHERYEAISGNAVLNGIPVTVTASP